MEFDEKSVVPVLEAKYDSFTQSEKNIADFFLKNKNQADSRILFPFHSDILSFFLSATFFTNAVVDA